MTVPTHERQGRTLLSVRLDDDLLRQTRHLAIDTGKYHYELLEELLKRGLLSYLVEQNGGGHASLQENGSAGTV